MKIRKKNYSGVLPGLGGLCQQSKFKSVEREDGEMKGHPGICFSQQGNKAF